VPSLISVYDVKKLVQYYRRPAAKGSRPLQLLTGDNMPRKKSQAAADQAADNTVNELTAAETHPTPAVPPSAEAPAGTDEPEEGQRKNWGPPYRAIFTCSAKGFEMGENRRFKQRVFKFKDKPAPEIIAELKEKGFVYRPEEKAWTIHADNASRQLSDELAAKFAGESQDIAR